MNERNLVEKKPHLFRGQTLILQTPIELNVFSSIILTLYSTVMDLDVQIYSHITTTYYKTFCDSLRHGYAFGTA